MDRGVRRPFGAGGLSQAPRSPVLLELFTSEGCSSCPAADVLLEALQREQPVDAADIIPVGLHVTYFNHLGWKDPYSSEAFTERQQGYSAIFGDDSVYTPQIVVDGGEAVAGNDGDVVRRAIATAATRPHLPLRVTVQVTGGTLRLAIDRPAAPANAEKIQLVAAITQDDLVSVVKRGENSGRTLHHVAVARKLQRFETLTGAASTVEARMPIERAWGPGGLKAVVWLQGVTSRKVYGTATSAITR